MNLFDNKNKEKLSKSLFWVALFVSAIIMTVDYFKEEHGIYFYSEVVIVGMHSIFAIFEIIKSRHFLRITALMLMASIHFPIRYYLHGNILSSTLLWFILLPTFGTFYFGAKYNKKLLLLTAIITYPVMFVLKIESFDPLSFYPLTGIEIKTIIGWSFITFLTTRYFYEQEKQKENFEFLLNTKIANDTSVARMTSLGEMAGGIAHEINNPLQVIVANSQLIQSHCKKDGYAQKDKVIKYATKILNTSFQIANLAKSVLAFSRKDIDLVLEKQPLQKTFDYVLPVIENKLRDNNIKMVIDENVLHENINHSPEFLAQILINLLSNSIYAVSSLENKWINIKFKELSDRYELLIVDSGNGISDEVLNKMFMPFFTTKPVGSGTGYGLSISRKLMEKMNGDIEYHFYESKYTSFIIYFKKV